MKSIAEKYDVKIDDLREWNNITGNKIGVGLKLKLFSDSTRNFTKVGIVSEMLEQARQYYMTALQKQELNSPYEAITNYEASLRIINNLSYYPGIDGNEAYTELENSIIEDYKKYVDELNEELSIKIVNLIKPADYLDSIFAVSKTGIKLNSNIIKFLDYILTKTSIPNSYLQFHSIDIKTFKGKNYLTIKLNNNNIYNSLKLTKYDIGNLIFDEVISNILLPLNEFLGGSNEFYGFDLNVITQTKNFAKDFASNENIEYRFLIPNHLSKSYKNQDISGQQVLDASIILMDDKRIELKLN